MREFQSAMQLISGRIPCVTLYLSHPCKWQGKWTVNWSTDAVKAAGGPWDTQEAAVNAVLATGYYKLREGTKTPHLDLIG